MYRQLADQSDDPVIKNVMLDFRTLRALLWFAARTVVSAQGLFTDTVATAFVAMAMCVEATDIAGAIAAGNSKGLLPFLLAGRKPACANRRPYLLLPGSWPVSATGGRNTHFAIGATLGGIFSGVLLILNIQHVLDVVQSSVAPKTTMIILIGGCCTYFAFGATITGFHFILMDNDPDGRSRFS